MSTPPGPPPIEIIECTTPALLRQFIEFPWEIYKDNPYWVPPLLSERVAFYDKTKNPFFEHSFAMPMLARRAGRVVGTIVAIHNTRHNETWQDKVGFFGGFECINDDAVAGALFDAAGAWVRARGLDTLRGPTTLSIYDESGMLIDGFDNEPKVLMTYNPRYYPALLDHYGFVKAVDMVSWWGDTAKSAEVVKGKWARVVQLAEKRGRFRVRSVDFGKIDEEVAALKTIFWSAWEKNWGNVPMTEHELEHIVTQLKSFADPDLIIVAEDAKTGKPIGFSLSLPNVNRPLRMAYPNPRTPEWLTMLKFLWHWKVRKQVNAMRFVLLGVLPEYRMGGVDAVMVIKTFEKMIEKKYDGGECGWILETNEAMNRVIAEGGTRIYKKYRIYDYKIGADSRG